MLTSKNKIGIVVDNFASGYGRDFFMIPFKLFHDSVHHFSFIQHPVVSYQINQYLENESENKQINYKFVPKAQGLTRTTWFVLILIVTESTFCGIQSSGKFSGRELFGRGER